MRLLEGTGPLGPLLPDHISEFVVGIILFFVIFVVVRKVVMPRMEKMYTQRVDDIQGGIDRADQAQAEAQAALAEYRAKLASAEEDAAQIRETAKAAGSRIQAELRAKAEDEASRIVTSARVQVEAERAQAVESLRKDVGGMATSLAGKILGESLDDDLRVKQTVDSFIDSLDKEPAQR